MYSKEYKLNLLKKFYLTINIKDMRYRCPFGKVHRNMETSKYNIMSFVPCMELCGLWVELGDVRSGCPCTTLGPETALSQIRKVLIKEGYLDSNGNDI